MEALFMEALKTFGAPVGMLLALFVLFATGKLYTSRTVRDMKDAYESRSLALEKAAADRQADLKEQNVLWRQAHAESETAREIQAQALRAALDVARESEEGWDLFRVWLNAQAGVAPFSDRARRPDE